MRPSPKAVGLIAGSGQLPLLFAAQAKSQGFSTRIVALQGAASPRLSALSDEIEWVSVGQLGKLISFFKKNGVRRAVMHGKVQHASLLKNPKLDFRAFALFARLRDRSGPSLLKAVGRELARHRVRLLDGRFLMESHLAPLGDLTREKPGWDARSSAAFGLKMARALAKLGVGQTVIVKKGAVVAVEGVEGTDEAIRRAGKWAGRGTIVVKVAGPRQDWRFDVPTVGPGTIRAMAQAGAQGLVLESGRAFLLSKDETLTLARKHKIFLTAVP